MAKQSIPKDWPRDKIKQAIYSTGHTLKSLSIAYGYRSVDAFAQALQRPYPKIEKLIAQYAGVPPEIIWPSRYQGKYSPACNARKVNSEVAA